MDSEETSNETNDGDYMSDDSDVPKPFWVRPIGLQNDRINKRLLEYNVYSVFIGLSVILFILSVF
jgi:hypothetical protein